ncbi:hypothetical protein SAMN04488168_11935 [Bacillus sp. 491mf]|nr:hypothetical protein SAMN04488168_11935 [Bacillus sp. 491mf]
MLSKYLAAIPFPFLMNEGFPVLILYETSKNYL